MSAPLNEINVHRPIRKSSYIADEIFGDHHSLSSLEICEISKSILQETTSALKRLSSIPSDILFDDKCEDSYNLRISLLKNATIVFFTAGYPGKKFIFEKAHKFGVKSIIIDSPSSWSKSLLESGIITDYIPFEMGSLSHVEVVRQSVDLLQNYQQTHNIRIDGICTFAELSVGVVSEIAEALNLPGHSPRSVEIARDKHLSRSVVSAANLPSVKSIKILNECELESAANYIGFPAVLKPISGADSLGVQRVNDLVELIETYRHLKHILSELVVSSGALSRRKKIVSDESFISTDGSENGEHNAEESGVNLTVMLEEYLDGSEVDVDVILSNQKPIYIGISDNGPTHEPWFGETWAVYPSLLPDYQKSELSDLVYQSLLSMGFENGVFHVEAKYTSRGPRLIEVNARMGGGPVCLIHKYTLGIDLVLATLMTSVGIPPILKQSNQNRSIAYYRVNTDNGGYYVENFDFLQDIIDLSDTIYCEPYIRENQVVIGANDGQQPTLLCELVVSAIDNLEARDLVVDRADYVLELFKKNGVYVES